MIFFSHEYCVTSIDLFSTAYLMKICGMQQHQRQKNWQGKDPFHCWKIQMIIKSYEDILKIKRNWIPLERCRFLQPRGFDVYWGALTFISIKKCEWFFWRHFSEGECFRYFESTFLFTRRNLTSVFKVCITESD